MSTFVSGGFVVQYGVTIAVCLGVVAVFLVVICCLVYYSRKQGKKMQESRRRRRRADQARSHQVFREQQQHIWNVKHPPTLQQIWSQQQQQGLSPQQASLITPQPPAAGAGAADAARLQQEMWAKEQAGVLESMLETQDKLATKHHGKAADRQAQEKRHLEEQLRQIQIQREQEEYDRQRLQQQQDEEEQQRLLQEQELLYQQQQEQQQRQEAEERCRRQARRQREQDRRRRAEDEIDRKRREVEQQIRVQQEQKSSSPAKKRDRGHYYHQVYILQPEMRDGDWRDLDLEGADDPYRSAVSDSEICVQQRRDAEERRRQERILNEAKRLSLASEELNSMPSYYSKFVSVLLHNGESVRFGGHGGGHRGSYTDTTV